MAMVMKRCTEDCLDEALCPSDFEFAGSIVDDDMSRWLTVLPPHNTHQLSAVCDCRHSATCLHLGLRHFMVSLAAAAVMIKCRQTPKT